MELSNINVIYGGSFNPPTIAHYVVSKEIIKRFKVNDFVFMPTSLNYGKKTLIDDKPRMDMLAILSSHIPNTRVSDFELKQEKYMGTYYTLEHFKGYYFVMGADNLNEIETWRHFPDVVKNNKFIVFKRNNIDCYEILNKDNLKAYKNNFIIIENFLAPNVSSSEYRKSLDKSIVLDDIHEYVINNKLYK